MLTKLGQWIKARLAGLISDGVEDKLEDKAVAAAKAGTKKLADFAVAKGLDAGRVDAAHLAVDAAVDKLVPLLVEAGVTYAEANVL